MKITVTESIFRDSFYQQDRRENFSYDGLTALFNHLLQIEEETGEELELDVVALCCYYTEYDSSEALLEAYNNLSLDDIKNETTVIEFDGGFIIQNF